MKKTTFNNFIGFYFKQHSHMDKPKCHNSTKVNMKVHKRASIICSNKISVDGFTSFTINQQMGADSFKSYLPNYSFISHIYVFIGLAI